MLSTLSERNTKVFLNQNQVGIIKPIKRNRNKTTFLKSLLYNFDFYHTHFANNPVQILLDQVVF